LFVCCVFVFFRAFFGIGHSAESCGVYAHKVTDPRSGSGFASGIPDTGPDTNDPEFPIEDGAPLDREGTGEQAHIWLGRIEEMYGYQYDWKPGEYEIAHDDGGDDHYDEYEHEDLSDPAL